MHRPVLLALAVLFVSGVALGRGRRRDLRRLADLLDQARPRRAAADQRGGAGADRARAPADGAGAARSEPGSGAGSRMTAYLSLLLWTGTVVIGTVLVNAA